jgi:2-polyprenyl-6-methoxyphenol hydroxylase-like FAD-dependent oxidoreductase
MTTKSDVQVLIAGAGPTGLALACDLARRGVQFRIVDKAEAYFIGSKGKGLQPRSLEVMDDFGIVDQIVRNGRFHIPFRAHQGATVLGERDPHEGHYPTPSTPYASPLLTPQWRVEEALRGLLERGGGQVELATELVALGQDADTVTATLARKDRLERVRYQYFVAADGGKSFVRKHLQVPFEGETWKDERMYVADVRLRGLDRGAWHSWSNHPEAASRFARCLPRTSFSFRRRRLRATNERPRLNCFVNGQGTHWRDRYRTHGSSVALALPGKRQDGGPATETTCFSRRRRCACPLTGRRARYEHRDTACT